LTLQEHKVKKIAILVFALFFSGCSAKYPTETNLKLQISSQTTGIYSNDTSAALRGHDARQNTAVVVYQLKGKPEIRIPNETAPHVLVTKRLADGLEEQGLVFASVSPVRIQLDLNELLVSVTRSKLLYSAKAKSHITLTIKNGKVTLTKTYDREASNDSVTRPPVQDLEKLLNNQLTEIVNQILQDEEVQATISPI